MKFFLIVAVCAFASFSHAQEPEEFAIVLKNHNRIVKRAPANALRRVRMKMELVVDGKTVSNPQFIANMNERTRVSQRDDGSTREYFIEVLPSMKNMKKPGQILMKFKVGQKENGAFMWVSNSEVIARSNHQAEVAVESSRAKEDYKKISFRVMPTLL